MEAEGTPSRARECGRGGELLGTIGASCDRVRRFRLPFFLFVEDTKMYQISWKTTSALWAVGA